MAVCWFGGAHTNCGCPSGVSLRPRQKGALKKRTGPYPLHVLEFNDSEPRKASLALDSFVVKHELDSVKGLHVPLSSLWP